MRWLLAATACVLAVDAAKQIVGNAYQYPLPGGGATTFIKGPAYADQINAIAANGPSAARSLLGGTVNSFTYAPHGTYGAQVNQRVVAQPVATHFTPAQVSHGIVQPHPLVNRVVHHYPGSAVSVSSPRVVSVPQQVTVRTAPAVAVQAPRLTVRVPQVVARPQQITVRAPQQIVVAQQPRQVVVSAPRVTVARAPQVVVTSPRVFAAPTPQINIRPAQVITARAPTIALSTPQVITARAPQIAVSSPRVFTSFAPQIAVRAPQVIQAPAQQIIYRPPQLLAARAPQITVSSPQTIAVAPQVVPFQTRGPQFSAVSSPGLITARVPQVTLRSPQVIAAPVPQISVRAPQIIAAPRPQITVRAPQIVAARAPQITYRAPQIIAAPAPRLAVSAPRVISVPAPRVTLNAIAAPQLALRAPQVIAARAPQIAIRTPQIIAARAPQIAFRAPQVIAAPAPQIITARAPQITVQAPQSYVARVPQVTIAAAPAPRFTVRAPQVSLAPRPVLVNTQRVISTPVRQVSVSAPQVVSAPAPRVTFSAPRVSVRTPQIVSVRNPQITVSAQPAPQISVSAPQVISTSVPQTLTVQQPSVVSVPASQVSVSSPQIITGRAPQSISFFTAPRSLRPAVTSFIGMSYLANNYLPQRLTSVTPVTQYSSPVISNASPSVTVVGASGTLQSASPNVIVRSDNNVLAPGISTIHHRAAAPAVVTSGASVNLGPQAIVRQSVPITGISSSVFTKLVHVPATTTIVSNSPVIGSVASSAPTTIGLSAPSGGLVTSVGSSAPLFNTVVRAPAVVASPQVTTVQRASSIGTVPGGSVTTLSAPAFTSYNNFATPVTTSITGVPSFFSFSPAVSRITSSAAPNQVFAAGPAVTNVITPGAAVTQVSGPGSVSVSRPIASSVPVQAVRNVVTTAARPAVITSSVAGPQRVVTQIARTPAVSTIVGSPIARGVVVAPQTQITRVPTQVIASNGISQLRPALGASVVAVNLSPVSVSIPARTNIIGSVPQVSRVTQVAAPVSGISTVAGPAITTVHAGLAPVVQHGGSVSGISSSVLTKYVQLPVSSAVLGPMYSQQFSIHTGSPAISIANQNNVLTSVPLTRTTLVPSVTQNFQVASQPVLTRFTANDAIRTQTLVPTAGNSIRVSGTPQTVVTTTSAQGVPVLQSNSLPVANTVTVSQAAVNQSPVSVSTAQTGFTLNNALRLALPRNLLTGYTVPVLQGPVQSTLTTSAIPAAPATVLRTTNAVSAEVAGLRPGSGYVTREVDTPIAARLTAGAQSTNVIAGERNTLHEVHIGGGQKTIRVEEYKSGPQVIRVHDSAPRPAQVLNVQAPQDGQDIVRIVSKNSGPPHVERVVHEGGTQVFDVQKPAAAPEQIVQIERGPATPPRIEVSEQQAPAIATTQVVAANPVVSVAGSRVRASPLARIASGPVATISADSAPQRVVVRKLVPAGTFGTRLRRRKLSKAATSS